MAKGDHVRGRATGAAARARISTWVLLAPAAGALGGAVALGRRAAPAGSRWGRSVDDCGTNAWPRCEGAGWATFATVWLLAAGVALVAAVLAQFVDARRAHPSDPSGLLGERPPWTTREALVRVGLPVFVAVVLIAGAYFLFVQPTRFAYNPND